MKTLVPHIIDYKPFYIQKADDEKALDTATEWGLMAKTNPYPVMPEPKDTYSNDFKDENGKDEYTDNIYYKPITFTVSFFIKTYDDGEMSAVQSMNALIDLFFEKIREGTFFTYDAYTGLGFRDVRYSKCDWSKGDYKNRDNWAAFYFDIEFIANDPLSRMMLKDGKITEKA